MTMRRRVERSGHWQSGGSLWGGDRHSWSWHTRSCPPPHYPPLPPSPGPSLPESTLRLINEIAAIVIVKGGFRGVVPPPQDCRHSFHCTRRRLSILILSPSVPRRHHGHQHYRHLALGGASVCPDNEGGNDAQAAPPITESLEYLVDSSELFGSPRRPVVHNSHSLPVGQQ